MLPLPLLPSFATLYRCCLSAAFSAFRCGASACVLEVCLLRLPILFVFPVALRPSSHTMTTPLYPNKCKQ